MWPLGPRRDGQAVDYLGQHRTVVDQGEPITEQLLLDDCRRGDRSTARVRSAPHHRRSIQARVRPARQGAPAAKVRQPGSRAEESHRGDASSTTSDATATSAPMRKGPI